MPRAVVVVLAVAVAVSSVSLVRGADGLSSQQTKQLDAFARALIACRRNVGLALALVRDGRTVFAGGYGYSDAETQRPVDGRTLFNIGSQTKAFTALLAADAVSKRLMTWDTPLAKLAADDFRLQDEFRTNEASLRDLLSHKLEMPTYWGVTTAAINMTRRELYTRLVTHILYSVVDCSSVRVFTETGVHCKIVVYVMKC